MSSGKLDANRNNFTGCWYLIVIFFAVIFWPVTLVLLAIGAIYFGFIYTRKNARHVAANGWINIYRFSPCCFNGIYGIIENIESVNNALRLTYRPIHIDHGYNKTVYSFESPWLEDSVQKTIDHIFYKNNGSLLDGLSVEASAIQTAINCAGKISWCTQSLRTIHNMLEQIDESLTISNGNPLLESSVDGMVTAKGDFEKQAQRIQDVKDRCSEMYENISEFLSVPSSLRNSDGIELISEDLGDTYNDIKSSYDYLIDYNSEYLALIREKM